ncbi:MAG: hypothetical protein ACTH3G_09640, partial [Citricoccus sp.]
MATRRPRVPKTSQRQFAEVGAGGSSRQSASRAGHAAYDAGPSPRFEGAGASAHPVGGHSAKVIPLDAAPSRQEPAPAGAPATGPAPEADTAVAEAAVVDSAEAAPEVEPADDPAAEPEPTPEQRRAEARRALLHRSTPRLRR